MGDIFDEYDASEAVRPATGAPVLDGSMTVADFNERFEATLDDTDYNTLGGYVFGELGKLPKRGDKVVVQGRTLEVVEMDGRRVKSLRVVAEDSTAEPQKRERN